MRIQRYKEGKTEIKKVEIKELGKNNFGKNAPTFVEYDGKTGFYKNSINTTQTMDKLDYIIYIIGSELGMEMAITSAVLDEDDKFIGIISENVAKNNEKLKMIIEIGEELNREDHESFISLEANIAKYKKIRLNNRVKLFKEYQESYIEDLDSLRIIINLFEKLIINIDRKDNKEEVIKHYYEMICLDLLTGNCDRNMKNYGILIDDEKNIRFSPLFDNAAINIPGLANNITQINGVFMPMELLIEYLITEKREYVEEVFKRIINSENIIKDIIINNSSILTDKERTWLSGRLLENFTRICEIVKEKHMKY